MNEKVIEIAGKNIVFKADGAFPIRYQSTFNKDFFSDLTRFEEADEDPTKFDSVSMFQMIYIAAKTADKSISPFFEFFAEFDVFPVFDVFKEILPMIWASVAPQKKPLATEKTEETC